MKTLMFTTAAALIAIANPAHAQLLGGGGLPAIPSIPAMPSMPTIPSMPSVPTAPISSVTNAAAAATATTAANHSINTRSGSASANGSATGSGSGTLDQTLNTPLSKLNAAGAGSANASGSAGTSASLIGTDAVRGVISQTSDAAGNTVTTVRDRAGSLVSTTRDKAGTLLSTVKQSAGSLSGSAAGSAQGSAAGSSSSGFSGLSQNLALAGSAAADGAGSFDVKPGMNLFDMDGEKIGKVREVFADAQGRIKGLVVKVEDTTATLPVADFAANGNALVTSMTESQIVANGEGQAAGSSSGSANGIFAGLSHNLALAGSAAADSAGTFDIKPGMTLRDMSGEKIGQVQQITADAKGRVSALVVKVEGQLATLPVSDFAAMGKGLVTSLSETQVTAAAQSQAAASGSAQAGN